MGLLDIFSQVNWIISFLMAIILAIIANLVTPNISNWLAKWSESRSSARIEELKSDFEETCKYIDSPSKLSLLISYSILEVLIFFSIASAIASLGTAMPFIVYASNSRLYEPEYLSVVYLLISSLLYLLGVIRAQKVIKITRRVRNFDKYRYGIEKSIASLEKSSSE